MSDANSDKVGPIGFDFKEGDLTIHESAVDYLLGQHSKEYVLKQGHYAYRVSGGTDGSLYYKKADRDWVLIANWCFYRLYMVVRYRKPVWLRPMYETLFRRMNFVCSLFDESAIELVATNGQVLRSRRFRLSPPDALEKVITEQFKFSPERVEELKAKLDL